MPWRRSGGRSHHEWLSFSLFARIFCCYSFVIWLLYSFWGRGCGHDVTFCTIVVDFFLKKKWLSDAFIWFSFHFLIWLGKSSQQPTSVWPITWWSIVNRYAASWCAIDLYIVYMRAHADLYVVSIIYVLDSKPWFSNFNWWFLAFDHYLIHCSSTSRLNTFVM